MTVIGWVQILLYCAIIVALTPVLGAYMTRVFSGERTFLSPVLRPVEVAIYKIAGVDERQEQHAVTYTVGMLLFHVGGFLILYVLMRAAGVAAVQSGRPIGGRAGPVVQHRGQLHHQHQLAELRRRKHDVLSRADARPDASELSVGGDRHRARRRADPRLRAQFGAHRRQFLGRYDALHALRPHSDLRAVTRCSWSGRASRRRSAPTWTRPRSRAPSRPSPSARSPRRSPSRCSAPMAAASSTPMPRIRSRTRPRCRTTCR